MLCAPNRKVVVATVFLVAQCGGVARDPCPTGFTPCGALCADLQRDPSNCGACGTVCAIGVACSAGKCATVCTANETLCMSSAGDVCVDTATDNANCGSCGVVCASGEACASGKCVQTCVSGLAMCGAQCVDTSTDLGNCGSCGATCAGECQAGHCLQLITHWSSSNVVVDDTYIYVESTHLSFGYYVWFSKANPVIWDFFDSQGSNNEINPIAVGTSGQTLYVNLTSGQGGTVSQVNIQNGKFLSSAVGGNAPWDALSITADASYVYWSTNSIYAAQRNGSTTGAQFIVVPNVAASRVVSDGTHLFWTDQNTGNISATTVASVSDAGVATTTLVTGETLSNLPSLTADATNVYWIDGQFTQSRCIRGVAKGGGTPFTVYCSTVAPQDIRNIAVDGTNVYFVDIGRGLVKVPVNGGPGTVLLDPSRYGSSGLFPTGFGVAVDGTSVYWTSAVVNDKGGVYKLTPK